MSNKLTNTNKKTFALVISIPIIMFLVAYASVPLYDLFCKVTGYGGTVQEVKGESEKIIDTDIKIRFRSILSAC